MMGRLTGKVALISGGAEGIGGAVGRLFADEGARVVLGDVQIAKAQALASEIGADALAVPLDVRDPAQWDAAVAATLAHFGKINVLCNIAGISEPGSVSEMPQDVWDRTLAINLSGTMNGMRAALAAIAASGEPGAVVNTGSMLALRVGGGFGAYCASKAAVTALSKVAALECAAAGWPIRVNTVHPGAIRTPMFDRYLAAAPDPAEMAAMFAANHPMGRVGEADEVARAFLFLASDEASFTSGVDLTVDGAGFIRA
jgi:3alpha(or 20beta)-hydroxysteroid dehydrogenase